jgi:ribosomal protein S18 acetylase RimI-like enzyme
MLSPPDPGTTVTLRVTTPVGSITVVGTVLEAGPGAWTIRRRDRSVMTVAVADIDAMRVVPPSRAARATVAEVENVAALGWRALESEPLGEWLLRASGGFTGRANSALCVGSPGMDVPAALERVTDWYAERGLPPRLQVPQPDVAGPLLDALAARGWTWTPRVHIMTAELAHVLRAAAARPAPPVEVGLADSVDDRWLAAYRPAEQPLPPAARAVLDNHPNAIFAVVVEAGTAQAVARVSVDGRWAGVFGVEVAAAARRQGLATAVSAAALAEAGRRGARHVYLQVSADNPPALAMYEGLNATVHHDYAYALGP